MMRVSNPRKLRLWNAIYKALEAGLPGDGRRTLRWRLTDELVEAVVRELEQPVLPK